MKNQLGKRGEQLARLHLEQNGYEWIFSNYRTSHGEIDLIMQDEEGVVFVEVKARTRGNWVAPNHQLSSEKLKRLEKAAHEYICKHEVISWRYLLISITVEKKSIHYRQILL